MKYAQNAAQAPSIEPMMGTITVVLAACMIAPITAEIVNCPTNTILLTIAISVPRPLFCISPFSVFSGISYSIIMIKVDMRHL